MEVRGPSPAATEAGEGGIGVYVFVCLSVRASQPIEVIFKV